MQPQINTLQTEPHRKHSARGWHGQGSFLLGPAAAAFGHQGDLKCRYQVFQVALPAPQAGKGQGQEGWGESTYWTILQFVVET